jgi:hypothetical protein
MQANAPQIKIQIKKVFPFQSLFSVAKQSEAVLAPAFNRKKKRKERRAPLPIFQHAKGIPHNQIFFYLLISNAIKKQRSKSDFPSPLLSIAPARTGGFSS